MHAISFTNVNVNATRVLTAIVPVVATQFENYCISNGYVGGLLRFPFKDGYTEFPPSQRLATRSACARIVTWHALDVQRC